jgi:TolB-like protein
MSPGIAAAWNGAGPDFGNLRDELGLEDEVEEAKPVVEPSLPKKKEKREIIKVVPAADLSTIRTEMHKKSGDLPESPYKRSDDLVDAICRDIKKKAGNKETIYIDTTALVYDKKNNQNEVIRLSSFLASKLRRYFNSNGLKNATIEDDADYFLGIRFHPHPDQEENIFQFVVELTSTETGESEDTFYYIESAKLPEDYLAENMQSKVFKVASEIADGQNKIKLWIEPFVEANSGRASAFSRAFSRDIENQIVNLQRGITVLVKPESGYVLKGQYVRRNGNVEITVRLVDPKGIVLKSVSLIIAESVIQDSLDLQ